jgi:hypothetical protein
MFVNHENVTLTGSQTPVSDCHHGGQCLTISSYSQILDVTAEMSFECLRSFLNIRNVPDIGERIQQSTFCCT